jgi:tetratricopeptide (TPR) repeat protein
MASFIFRTPFRLAVLCLSSGAVLGACSKAPEEPEFDHGLKKPLVRKLREELAETPCDKAKAQQLGQLLLDTGDTKGLGRVADTFGEKCGPNVVLLQLAYTANARAGEKEQALKAATGLVTAQPNNASYLVWRGLSLEALGRNEESAAELQKAFNLEPAQRPILNALVKAYDAQGKACEALAAFERYVEAKPSDASAKSELGERASKTSCMAAESAPDSGATPEAAAKP